jgi:5'-methylthioadenosine phosphorylase
MNKTLAIVGGSGLYDLTCFQNINSYEISTPWGMPSDKIYELSYETTKILFSTKTRLFSHPLSI